MKIQVDTKFGQMSVELSSEAQAMLNSLTQPQRSKVVATISQSLLSESKAFEMTFLNDGNLHEFLDPTPDSAADSAWAQPGLSQ